MDKKEQSTAELVGIVLVMVLFMGLMFFSPML